MKVWRGSPRTPKRSVRSQKKTDSGREWKQQWCVWRLKPEVKIWSSGHWRASFDFTMNREKSGGDNWARYVEVWKQTTFKVQHAFKYECRPHFMSNRNCSAFRCAWVCVLTSHTCGLSELKPISSQCKYIPTGYSTNGVNVWNMDQFRFLCAVKMILLRPACREIQTLEAVSRGGAARSSQTAKK